MKRIDQFLAFLAYSKRVLTQLVHPKTARYFYLVFRGFTPNKGIFYDFKTYGYGSYVTDYDRYLKTRYINYKYRDLFRDKYINYLFLKQYTDKVVPVYALIDNGVCHLLNGTSNLKEIFAQHNKFVVKPRSGWGGKGIVVLEIKNGEFFLNGVKAEHEDRIFHGFADHILVPYVNQHSYAKSVNEKSLNTIRLLTAVYEGQVCVLASGHRFGGTSTGFVDNFTQGGISAKVNVDSGTIEDPTILDKRNYRKIKVEYHPDSKRRITGIQIPRWDELVSEIKDLHKSIDFIKYVGWDIAITPDSFQIIEANYVSDLDGLQMHAPLLTNERNRNFYSEQMNKIY